MTIRLQHRAMLTKSILGSVRGTVWSWAVCLSWGVAAPAIAANQITFYLESTPISVAIANLESFAQTGDPSFLPPEFVLLPLENQQKLQRQLNRSISIRPNEIDPEEQELLALLAPGSTEEQQQYILQLIAARGNSQFIIDFLKALPVDTLTQENFISTLEAYNAEPIDLNTINATLTADFHYGLYHGQADGSGLTFVGRDLNRFWDNSKPLPWHSPDTFSFNANAGDYLYVLTWDGFDIFRSWIGEFKLSNGVSLVSNSTHWEYAIASGVNPALGDIPSVAELMPKITSATWTTPNAVGFNGIAPWGTVPGISPSAQFLVWPNSSTDSAIFRTKLPVVEATESVPEPASVVGILVAGILGVVTRLKHKRQ